MHKVVDNLKFAAGVLAILGGLGLGGFAIMRGISDANNIVLLVFAVTFVYSGYYTVMNLVKEDDDRLDLSKEVRRHTK